MLAPEVISMDRLRVRSESADGGLKVGIAIDRTSHGSDMIFGVAWVRPGTQAVTWEADDNTHEAYYVVTGSLRIEWSGPETGTSTFGPQDSVYFPPGRTYTIENAGGDDAFFVWAMTGPSELPPPSDPTG
jgi:mannose-6-phosphate isomerase-like protein (cupin superfamily)